MISDFKNYHFNLSKISGIDTDIGRDTHILNMNT